MAYDEALAERVRRALAGRAEFAERKMFGGLAFLAGGNMVCGIVGEDLMLRVGAEAHEAALARPGARPMDFSGRPMRGMVYVAPAALRSDEALRSWLEPTLAFGLSLPAKAAAATSRGGRKSGRG